MSPVALSIANNYGVALTVFTSVKVRLVRLAVMHTRICRARYTSRRAAQDSLSIPRSFSRWVFEVHSHARRAVAVPRVRDSYVHASQNHKLSLTRESSFTDTAVREPRAFKRLGQGTVSLTSASSDLRIWEKCGSSFCFFFSRCACERLA